MVAITATVTTTPLPSSPPPLALQLNSLPGLPPLPPSFSFLTPPILPSLPTPLPRLRPVPLLPPSSLRSPSEIAPTVLVPAATLTAVTAATRTVLLRTRARSTSPTAVETQTKTLLVVPPETVPALVSSPVLLPPGLWPSLPPSVLRFSSFVAVPSKLFLQNQRVAMITPTIPRPTLSTL
ncbi:hypothetical protein BJ742DRAFT_793391 [Cladochytrium replicatum]|nr:hypothetical protein BJ742DRAFT_793391 [Cladochytrium replicatum]